jgi:hypothetical protein
LRGYTDSDSDSDSDANSHSHTNGYSHGYSHTNTYIDANPNRITHTYSDAYPMHREMFTHTEASSDFDGAT